MIGLLNNQNIRWWGDLMIIRLDNKDIKYQKD